MKRLLAAKICYGISAVLFAIFVGRTIFDAVQYTKYMGSAPFEVFLLVNALWLVLPALLVGGLGLLLHKKSKK